MNWYLAALQKYATFQGRARRKEYWMFTLFSILIGISIDIADLILFGYEGITPLGILYSLAILLPSLAVSVRRLHDVGRGGWFMLLIFIPIVGWLVLLVFSCLDSQPGNNKYGPNPKSDEVTPPSALVK